MTSTPAVPHAVAKIKGDPSDCAPAPGQGKACMESIDLCGREIGTVAAVNISADKGQKKTPVGSVVLKKNHGIVGDAHAGDWRRQVSLLAIESIEKMRLQGLTLQAGSFAENITTRGIELPSLPLGAKVGIGYAMVEVTQIGKECHERCAIYEMAGDCIMPREGIFARVIRGGTVRPGDEIVIL